MHVRPIRPDDSGRLARFHERQSPESIYFRYFSPRPRLSSHDIERFTTVDYVDRMAFIGLLGDEMVGIARYDRPPPLGEAEVAFFTDDSNVGRGIGTVLLEYLAAAARDVGISRFSAQVLPQNRRMLSVFKQAGFAVNSRFADGVIEVELAIEPTEEALAAMEHRAKTAETRSIARILAPHSIAVIGASRKEGTLGYAVFRRLLEGGFEGPVYPVNPQAGHVASVRAFPTVLDVPDEIDLAVVVVPTDHVAEVVEECGRKRVQGLVILTGGFADAGPKGAERERRLVEQARGLGMRMVGPNTMGVINTAPSVRMHASFTEVVPRPGRIGVSSQSGTIGAAVLDHLGNHELGISTFVAMGNKGDVSGNDLLQYWEQDERTDVVVLYLESFGNPRNFARIARRLSQQKPVVAVKAGRSMPVGLEDLAEHVAIDGTAAVMVGADWPVEATFDALLRQTGLIRVDTLEQLTDVTRVLASQPLPTGPRVALLSNFWGPAVLAADACAGAGLVLADIDAANPCELSAEAGPTEYAAAIRTLLAHDAVDALVVVHAPPLVPRTAEVVRAVASVAGEFRHKPVVAAFLGPHHADALEKVGSVPLFAFPEGAVYALGRIARYAAWRKEPIGTPPDLAGCDVVTARSRSAQLLSGGGPSGRWIDPVDALALLATYGITPVGQQLVRSVDEAVGVAGQIGYPVALKASGLRRPAKTEAGGVAVDVHGDEELRAAYGRMAALHGPAMDPALVQQMAPTGTDVAIGLHQHPAMGSVVTLGLAGVAAVELRILPLTDMDAERLVATVPGLGALGARSLADLLLRISALADAVPEMAVLGFDPVLVSDRGAHATDTRLRLAPWVRTNDPAVRRL